MVAIFASASALLTPEFVESFEPEKLASKFVKVEKEYGVKFSKIRQTFNIVGHWEAVQNAHKSLMKLKLIPERLEEGDVNELLTGVKIETSTDNTGDTAEQVDTDGETERNSIDGTEDNGAIIDRVTYKIKGNPRRGRYTGDPNRPGTVPDPVVFLQYQDQAYSDNDKVNIDIVLDEFARGQTEKKVTKEDLKKILEKNTEQMGRPLNKNLPRGASLPVKKVFTDSFPRSTEEHSSIDHKILTLPLNFPQTYAVSSYHPSPVYASGVTKSLEMSNSFDAEVADHIRGQNLEQNHVGNVSEVSWRSCLSTDENAASGARGSPATNMSPGFIQYREDNSTKELCKTDEYAGGSQTALVSTDNRIHGKVTKTVETSVSLQSRATSVVYSSTPTPAFIDTNEVHTNISPMEKRGSCYQPLSSTHLAVLGDQEVQPQSSTHLAVLGDQEVQPQLPTHLAVLGDQEVQPQSSTHLAVLDDQPVNVNEGEIWHQNKEFSPMDKMSQEPADSKIEHQKAGNQGQGQIVTGIMQSNPEQTERIDLGSVPDDTYVPEQLSNENVVPAEQNLAERSNLVTKKPVRGNRKSQSRKRLHEKQTGSMSTETKEKQTGSRSTETKDRDTKEQEVPVANKKKQRIGKSSLKDKSAQKPKKVMQTEKYSRGSKKEPVREQNKTEETVELDKTENDKKKKTGKGTIKDSKPNPAKEKKEGKVYQCTECDYKGCRKKRLTEHMGRVHGLLTENCRGTQEKTTFPCDMCDKTFVFGKDLNRHKKIVHHGQVHFCSVCQKSYKSKYVFDKHMTTHEAGYVQPMFSCQICDRQFTTKFSLGCHIKSEHLGLKKTFLCPTCGKSFSQIRSYRQHANVHAGIRPYVCEICGKSFTYDKSLKEHRYMHDNIRRFPCTVCGKAFRQRTCLLIHMKVHKDTKDHICSCCGKGFTQKQSLLRHERIHSGDKPYTCKLCQKSFSDYAVIRKHMLMSHKKDKNNWKDDVISEAKKTSDHYITGGPGYVPRETCSQVREKNCATVLPPKKPGGPTVIIGHNGETKKDTEMVSMLPQCNMSPNLQMESNVNQISNVQSVSVSNSNDLASLYQPITSSMYSNSNVIALHQSIQDVSIAMTELPVTGKQDLDTAIQASSLPMNYGNLQVSPQVFQNTSTDAGLIADESMVAAFLKAQGRQSSLGAELLNSLGSFASVSVSSVDQTQGGQSQGQLYGMSSVAMTTNGIDQTANPDVSTTTSQSWVYPGYNSFYNSANYQEFQPTQPN